jgi:DNA-directed RNA polymerase specialized sigma24 family protein
MGECKDAIVARCLSRIRRWRVPANYSRKDWAEELAAVVACAAVVAQCEYDDSRGVPLDAFLYERVFAAALARYRQGWRFGYRYMGEFHTAGEPPHRSTIQLAGGNLASVIARLPEADRHLITGLFWDDRTEAELAAQFAVTQQAISKRKSAVLKRLRSALEQRKW